MSSSKNPKFCEWFGHDDVSQGPDRTSDFPSETMVCARCGDTHNLNSWGGPRPPAKIRKVILFLLVAGCITFVLANLK